MALVELLGEKLQSKTGEISTADALKGKTVGIYFSAHWCPPCRGFTPVLAESYKVMTAAGKPFEIVFVSSDRDEATFSSYFSEMPWLALPYPERERKAKLSKKFKVNGIPTLVIVDEEGKTITADGRSAIDSDPKGENFPWTPPSVEDALGDEVIMADGEAREVKDIRDEADVLALYFSAHWCPPCRAFTPKLGEMFGKVVAAGKKFAVIFVSSDRDAGSFNEYLASMPPSWCAVPPSDKRKGQLSKLFDVAGIPRLVVLDAKTLEIINSNARGAVSADAGGANFPWKPPAVANMSEPEGINDSVSIALMLEGCTKEVQDTLVCALEPFANEVRKEEMLFFAARSSEGAAPQVRKLTELGQATSQPQLLILDIPDEGGFYTFTGDVTPDTVREFVAAYKAGSLERKQLS